VQYGLIEACSVLRSREWCGPQLGGGASVCGLYTVNVQLQPVPAGNDVTATPYAKNRGDNSDCPLPTLLPNASVDLWIDAFSTQPMIYSVEPVLAVVGPNGKATVLIPGMAGKMAFADPSHFTCYRLQGTTLVNWRQGPDAVDYQARAMENGWCI
jgi:hypothetical protein